MAGEDREYPGLLIRALKELDLGDQLDDGYYRAKVSELTTAAAYLSAAVGRGKPWTWRYLRNVLNEHITPGADLGEACRSVLAVERGEKPAAKTGKETVAVIADPDRIPPGTVVFGSARICANKNCPVYFLPKTWNHKYCTARCRREQR